MSNCGKFVDRNPTMRSAGICTVKIGSTGSAMKMYSVEEAAEDVLRTKRRKKYQEFRDDLLPYHRCVPEENVKELLSPESKKSRFVEFREKFAENMYFKKPELGKVFPAGSKPENITNDNTTFGYALIRSEPAYDLVFPHKTPEEVNREYIRWHDKYIISHNHYLPGEQIRRHYPKPFNPNAHFGIVYDVDINGKNVKRVMEQCDNLIVVSKAQKQFLERTMGHLGHAIKRNITPDTPLGVRTVSDYCNVKALIEVQDQCERTSPLIDAIGHLNKIRQNLFERQNFHMQDLKLALEASDVKKTGLLPLKQIFEIMRRELVYCNPQNVITALRHFQLIEDEGQPTEAVKYEELWKLLHIQYPIPKTGNISKMPPNIYNKDTTYRFMCKDLKKPPVQGRTLKRLSLKHEEPTTVKDVISPDIPMKFGLAPSDFAKLRAKHELRRIYKNLLDDEKFENIWTTVKNYLQRSTELISVDEMRQVMHILKK
ncbi:EF-hand domain-containing family member B-like [Eurosta solidaginis]|uniref:EF-hand domain-containing family member B-like n=1 Tax=Eurosta solidaginis TaxID=178769 RepID=UPI00353160EC